MGEDGFAIYVRLFLPEPALRVLIAAATMTLIDLHPALDEQAAECRADLMVGMMECGGLDFLETVIADITEQIELAIGD